MCFDMTMAKNKTKFTGRRATKSGAGLRMRSKNPMVDDREDERGLITRLAASTTTTVRSKTIDRPSRKATLRKRQQKRMRVMMCLVEVENVAVVDHHQEEAFTRFTYGAPQAVPSSSSPSAAMAPANTTQYLMAGVADDQFDFQPGSTTTSTASSGPYGEGHPSPSSVYVSLDNAADYYETCLAFQQRSFEAELNALYDDDRSC